MGPGTLTEKRIGYYDEMDRDFQETHQSDQKLQRASQLATKAWTQRRIAAVVGSFVTIVCVFTIVLLLSRIPGARAAMPATPTFEPPAKTGPLRVLFQQFFQNFVLGMRNAVDLVGTQPQGLQEWLDKLILRLPQLRSRGRISSLVLTTKTAILTDIGVDEKMGEYRKYSLMNGVAFFEGPGEHLQLMPMAAEVTLYPDHSKVGTEAPAMCVPLPQIALVEKRDGTAGRIDAAEFLMKHPEVRNYMSQIFTSGRRRGLESRNDLLRRARLVYDRVQEGPQRRRLLEHTTR